MTTDGSLGTGERRRTETVAADFAEEEEPTGESSAGTTRTATGETQSRTE